VAGPHCDAVVVRVTLGSRRAFARSIRTTGPIRTALNLAEAHWRLVRSDP